MEQHFLHCLKDQLCFLKTVTTTDQQCALSLRRYCLQNEPAELTPISSHAFILYPDATQIHSTDLKCLRTPYTNNLFFKFTIHLNDDSYNATWHEITHENIHHVFTGHISKAVAILVDPVQKDVSYALFFKPAEKNNSTKLAIRKYRAEEKTDHLKSRSILKLNKPCAYIIDKLVHTFIIDDSNFLRFIYRSKNLIHQFRYNCLTKKIDTVVYPPDISEVLLRKDGTEIFFSNTNPLDDIFHQITIQKQDLSNTISHELQFDPSVSLIISPQSLLGAIMVNHSELYIIDLRNFLIIGKCDLAHKHPSYECQFFEQDNYYFFKNDEKFYCVDLRKIKQIIYANEPLPNRSKQIAQFEE
jgi:hypothetical protein